MCQQQQLAPAVTGHGMPSTVLVVHSVINGGDMRVNALVAVGALRLATPLMIEPVVLLGVVLAVKAGPWRGSMMLASAPHRTTALVVAGAP
jgi:hypothetical protein